VSPLEPAKSLTVFLVCLVQTRKCWLGPDVTVFSETVIFAQMILVMPVYYASAAGALKYGESQGTLP
jgi:hypothetical protein